MSGGAVTPRPTSQEVFDRILECQGEDGMRKMLRAFNTLELVIDYGGLKGLPAGPEAMEAYQMICDHCSDEGGAA